MRVLRNRRQLDSPSNQSDKASNEQSESRRQREDCCDTDCRTCSSPLPPLWGMFREWTEERWTCVWCRTCWEGHIRGISLVGRLRPRSEQTRRMTIRLKSARERKVWGNWQTWGERQYELQWYCDVYAMSRVCDVTAKMRLCDVYHSNQCSMEGRVDGPRRWLDVKQKNDSTVYKNVSLMILLPMWNIDFVTLKKCVPKRFFNVTNIPLWI